MDPCSLVNQKLSHHNKTASENHSEPKKQTKTQTDMCKFVNEKRHKKKKITCEGKISK
jgi:hypothetical protein